MNSAFLSTFGFFAAMDREGRGMEYDTVKLLLFFALKLFTPGDTLNWQT